MNSLSVATALFCLVSLSVSAEGLKCFSCTGNECADTYEGKTDHQVQCTSDIANKALEGLKSAGQKLSSVFESVGINTKTPDFKFVCTKLKVKSGENEIVSRSCGMATEKVEVCDSLKNENTICSSCDSDLCNGATAAQMNLGLVAAVTTILAATYFR